MQTATPIRRLSIYFWLYKTLVLTIALLAPGPGYDTSTTLLEGTNKLVRWDALYFVQKAQRGDVFEQEWAFGKGLSTILSTVTQNSQDISKISLAGVILSHISHYLATLLLYGIADQIRSKDSKDAYKHMPFIAACLYIIAPAGVFLSAPYSEAPFAFLNMLGFWIYIHGHYTKAHRSLWTTCLYTIIAGVIFGLGTVVRSNGLLSGTVLLYDAIVLTLVVLTEAQHSRVKASNFVKMGARIFAGIATGLGLVYPQWLGYAEYCVGLTPPRPWCASTVPSIFSFVQAHYWNVGFLRYWTISNLPLFLLAAPMLWLMIRSAQAAAFRGTFSRRLALPQLVLALLAITNYHVQIITRLASAYPWVYIWLAEKVCSRSGGTWEIRFFVMYGLIQAGLFASFLPPA